MLDATCSDPFLVSQCASVIKCENLSMCPVLSGSLEIPLKPCEMQGEAIAVNLREMFGFRVPIISVVIGEGGSGGALAIGCANHSFIMENAVYYVASPEACAAILWKSREQTATVSHYLKLDDL